jgi:hypothetical protein
MCQKISWIKAQLGRKRCKGAGLGRNFAGVAVHQCLVLSLPRSTSDQADPALLVLHARAPKKLNTHVGLSAAVSSMAANMVKCSQAAVVDGPFVCTGCCSQLISSHVLGSRSYVSGLLIDTRVVALLGLRTHRDLITGQVDHDQKGRQILGA